MKKLFLLIIAISAVSCKFSAQNTGTFTDQRDGHIYKWKKFGEQVWMVENLAFLPSVNKSRSESQTVPYYYVYNYDGTDLTAARSSENYKTYGVLYNWKAAMTACPKGWHLPTKNEWLILSKFLIDSGLYTKDKKGDKYVSGKSVASTSKWIREKEMSWLTDSIKNKVSDDLSSNDESDFNALPAGEHIGNGGFYKIELTTSFWTATEYFQPTTDAYEFGLSSNSPFGFIPWPTTKVYGLSVRCVKD